MTTGIGSEIPDWLDVSPETADRLRQLSALVAKWTPAINLVSKSTLPHLWSRHILDSAQLFALAPATATRWLDLGSGGGFPGLVIAVLAAQPQPETKVILVESDQRKCVFLSEAARQLSLRVDVQCLRIEDLSPQSADVLTARALAPLSQLCAHAARHLHPGGKALLQKGALADSEVRTAQTDWRFDLIRHRSRTDPAATILDLKAIRHV